MIVNLTIIHQRFIINREGELKTSYLSKNVANTVQSSKMVKLSRTRYYTISPVLSILWYTHRLRALSW